MGKGPYCMSYGFGLAIVVTLLKNSQNLIFIYIVSLVICTAVEYISGVILEKAFGKVMWDYTKLKFGIGKHISLEFMLIWGAFGILVIKCIMPFVDSVIFKMTGAVKWLFCITSLIILLDYYIASIKCFRNIKIKGKEKINNV